MLQERRKVKWCMFTVGAEPAGLLLAKATEL